MADHRWPKAERLHQEILIKELFRKGSSFFIYPYKVLYLSTSAFGYPAVLISVPKRNHRRATVRNLIRRRTREAYRLQKKAFLRPCAGPKALALVYVAKQVHDSHVLHNRMKRVLQRLDSLPSGQ